MEVARAPNLKMKEIGKEIAKEVEVNVRRSFEKFQEDLVKIINEAFSPIQQELKVTALHFHLYPLKRVKPTTGGHIFKAFTNLHLLHKPCPISYNQPILYDNPCPLSKPNLSTQLTFLPHYMCYFKTHFSHIRCKTPLSHYSHLTLQRSIQPITYSFHPLFYLPNSSFTLQN